MSLLLLQEPLPPTCLSVLVQPPLFASVNALCPYKERARADCTICCTSAGVLQGQGTTLVRGGEGLWREDGGVCMRWGWWWATILLWMTPIREVTKIGSGRERDWRRRMRGGGRWRAQENAHVRPNVSKQRMFPEPPSAHTDNMHPSCCFCRYWRSEAAHAPINTWTSLLLRPSLD